MTNKRIILTQEQISKLCEGEDFVYLSDLASKPDLGDIYSKEITTDGSIDDGYPKPTTTDDRSHTMTNNWRGNAKLAGMGGVVVREMSKKDWEKSNIIDEESEHGNARLKNRRFGGESSKSYTATKMAVSRKNNAEKRMRSNDPVERRKGAETLRKMHDNWSDLDVADAQYRGAKLGDEISQKGKPITSSPKVSGNGKAHSPKNGVFLN
jgi:hypothetical protein